MQLSEVTSNAPTHSLSRPTSIRIPRDVCSPSSLICLGCLPLWCPVTDWAVSWFSLADLILMLSIYMSATKLVWLHYSPMEYPSWSWAMHFLTWICTDAWLYLIMLLIKELHYGQGKISWWMFVYWLISQTYECLNSSIVCRHFFFPFLLFHSVVFCKLIVSQHNADIPIIKSCNECQ